MVSKYKCLCLKFGLLVRLQTYRNLSMKWENYYSIKEKIDSNPHKIRLNLI